MVSNRRNLNPCIASWFRWQSLFFCSPRSASRRAFENHPPARFHRRASTRRAKSRRTSAQRPPANLSQAQVQPAAPPAKFRRGAPPVVQVDGFFNCDSHSFNMPTRPERHAGRALRNLLRNAIAKTSPDSPLLLCCTVPPLCLVSGALTSNRQHKLSLFLTDNLS